MGRVGWADLSRGEVFIQEVLSGFSLIRGEGVYLPDLWGEGVIEVYFMVVGSRRGNVVGGFLGEHRGKGGIFRGECGLGLRLLSSSREFGGGGQLGNDW